MLTLALDTATHQGRFALAEDGEVLEYRPLNVSGSFADAILPMIERMLSDAGRTKAEVKRLAATCGPGSFTGVRIGVATAKGLAWALGCELMAVTTLEAMAGALLEEHADADLAVPVLDARRGEVFAAVYRRAGEWLECLAEPGAASPDRWWERLTGLLDDVEAPVYAGDGARLLLGEGETLRPELRDQGQPMLRRWSSAHPATARTLARVGSLAESPLPVVHPFSLLPQYLRASDAEVKRHVDLTPQQPGADIDFHQGRRKDP